MQEHQSCMLDTAGFEMLQKTKLKSATFSSIEKASFADCDLVLIKSLNSTFSLQNLTVISHENRILNFKGKHSDIVAQ